MVFTQVGGSRSSASAVAIQPDGKIVVAGTRYGEDFAFAIARYNADGTLDKTFDGDGRKTITVNESSTAYDVAIQRDGKIVIAGSDYNGRPTITLDDTSNNDFAVVRLNPDGSMDKSFDGDGKATVAMGFDEWAHAVTIDYSGTPRTNANYGKIILAGSHFAYGKSHMALARLHANGRRDMSFDRVPGLSDTGYNIDPFPGRRHTGINGVVVQPDGKIVVAGYAGDTFNGGSNQFALSRYDANGKRDKSFGPNGNGVIETGFGGADFAYSVVALPDGGLVAGGSVNGQFALAAYDADGRPNTTFGTDGKAKFMVGEGAARLALAPDGKLMIAGGKYFHTARVLPPAQDVTIQSHYQKASEQGARLGSIVIRRATALSAPLRVYYTVGGSAKLGADYTTAVADPSRPAGSFVNQLIGGGILGNVLTGGASRGWSVIGGLGGKIAGGKVTGHVLEQIGPSFVDIPAGRDSVTVNLNPIDDNLFEPVETATFTLTSGPGYSIGGKRDATVQFEDNEQIHVNFQTADAPTPAGYVADVGRAFGDRGNGLSFGWSADNTANARRRANRASPDARYDTYNHMQKNGANLTWELAVPNGLYQVRIVAGDPNVTDSLHAMNLEGVPTMIARPGVPSPDARWFRSTAYVQVNDGRLTLSNYVAAKNNKIAFIDVKAAPIGAKPEIITPVALPVRLHGPATASQWTAKPSGLFADTQFDEKLWA